MTDELRFDKTKIKTKHISEILINTFEPIEKRYKGTESAGVATGFCDLDAMTSGFKRGEVVVVAARPKMGKTAFALNAANNIAQRYNKPTIIFSLKMDEEEIAIRLLSMEAEIEGVCLQNGKLSKTEWEFCKNAIARLSDTPLYVHFDSSLIFADLKTTFNRVALDAGEAPGLIVFDYLQLLVDDNTTNRVQELSHYTREFKQLATELKCPIILLSQLPCEVENRDNKRPILSDLRENGSIEQDADKVLMLYRDEYYNLDTRDKGLAEVGIVKNPHGCKGIVKLLFEPQFTKFKNLIKPSQF